MSLNSIDAFPEVLEALSSHLQANQQIYLVGGVVRDSLLNRPLHDIDFAVSGGTRRLARAVADALHGDFYRLDEERDTCRVLYTMPRGGQMTLDFAALRADSLEEDLRARDFTINAMAIDIRNPDELIDPTGGLQDLRGSRLQPCSPESLQNDPARVLRAVRQSLSLRYRMSGETLRQIRAAAPLLPRISAERVRDELFRMLEGGQVAAAFRLLNQLDILEYVLPELKRLQGVQQSAPHIYDVWDHTLAVVQALDRLLNTLAPTPQQEKSADLWQGSVSLYLGRYRGQIDAHLSREWVPGRTVRSTLFFAALYHDISKPQVRRVEESGRVRFFDHDALGAEAAAERARLLALSSAEEHYVQTLIARHMRVHFLAKDGQQLSRRLIYRFFRDCGPVGVDVCLHSLADTLGTYGYTLNQDRWLVELQTCRTLLDAFWEQPEQVVSPPRLLTGNDLIAELGMRPGPQMGQLLEIVREGQAVGEITDRAAALDFARAWLLTQ